MIHNQMSNKLEPSLGDKVLTTTNYTQFRHVCGNRAIRSVTVKDLKKRLSTEGQRDPIKVNADMGVIDGQHRLEACRELGIPVKYIIDQDATIDTARSLNTSQHPWKATDFIASYAETGNENYVRVQKFMKETGLAFRIALKALCPNIIGAEQLAKEGKLVVTNEDVTKGREIFAFWHKFTCLSRDSDQIRNIYLVLLFLMNRPEVDLKRLERSLLKNGVKPFHGMDGAVREINESYNIGAPKAKKLDFAPLYADYLDRRRHNR